MMITTFWKNYNYLYAT